MLLESEFYLFSLGIPLPLLAVKKILRHLAVQFVLQHCADPLDECALFGLQSCTPLIEGVFVLEAEYMSL